MKKSIYLLSLLILFAGCKAIQKLSQQKVNNIENCSSVIFNGKHATLDVEVNQQPYSFLFDTGAGVPVVQDTMAVRNYSDKDFYSFGSFLAADRNKTSSTLFTASLNSQLFNSSNKAFLYIPRLKTRCPSVNTYSGIIGLDVFFHDEMSLKLDFTESRICNISKLEKNEALKNDKYELIKSECKRNTISIFLKIEGNEYKFKFDTGYTGNLIMPKAESGLKPINAIYKEYSGSLYTTVSSLTIGNELIYYDIPVNIGQYNINSTISVSSTIKTQNIGIDFIKGFDWIIDYNNNEVYFKRNDISIPAAPSWSGNNFAVIKQDKIVIILQEINDQKFKVGDQIVAVNSEKVTKDNACELLALLNKTTDWNTLDIEMNEF